MKKTIKEIEAKTQHSERDKRGSIINRIPAGVLYTVLVVITSAIFLADYNTVLGVAVWVLYIIPLTISLLAWTPTVPVLTAGGATFFMVLGFMTDDPGVSQKVAQLNRAMGLSSIWVMALVGYFYVKNKVSIRIEEWIQRAYTGLNHEISGEKTTEEIGDNLLRFLSEYLGAQAGAFYVRDGKVFQRMASYGIVPNGALDSFNEDQTLAGRAVKDKKVILLENVDDGFLDFGSSLGRGKPHSVVIVPAVADERVVAVFELGFSKHRNKFLTSLLERLSELVGVTVRSTEYRNNLQKLLEETQRQSEELQAQSEELRVANEELEEQSNALQESQSRLEQQQAEVEQTNVQLEEQAQMLEIQKTELEQAKEDLLQRAHELEKASQYKSDFLANMSHELRTPLNSTLILAKLLSENKDENLTDDQIKYAETIYSAGNDLLNLIDDILDLSKIEAGYMEIQPEKIYLSKIADEMKNIFEPIANKKGIKLKIDIDKNCPKKIFTDPKRLEQILKNLLSNACKFTEDGSVTLGVSCASGNDKYLDFFVTDTGIGIADDKQKDIFDAFKQADGTTSRHYGGTGLGLSISRELSQLLGGHISLESKQGTGSTFSVTLPIEYEGENQKVISHNVETSQTVEKREEFETVQPDDLTPHEKTSSIDDDRDDLKDGVHTLLIVEDDTAFANILFDMAHEMNFQALVAGTAQEGLYLAKKYKPNAIVLDVGLPDASGLSVLDMIKQDDATRHIPVHIISANDYTNTALSLGAAGYLLKPVKKDALQNSLRDLEEKMLKNMQRLLIVEDNATQLNVLKTLLGTEGVKTVGVRSAKACLSKLKKESFDCMVLDLNLPDSTGFELLETLSNGDEYSFPPVIVYTGQNLTKDEEQKLRRYSQSIIIKGARSPERLLDEVTLFLHQMVSDLSEEQQKMLKQAKHRDSALDGRRILIVEDDIRNVYSLTSILEPRGAIIDVAHNGIEALEALDKTQGTDKANYDLVLMDVMMPQMDGLTATRKIRKNKSWQKLPIIVLTAKAMKDDQEKCIEAGASDYMTKPIDVEKLLSLLRVWMPR